MPNQSNEKMNIDFSPSLPSNWKKTKGPVKITFGTIVSSIKHKIVVIIRDSDGKILGCWSKFHTSNSVEERESSYLLLSLEMALQNNHKTVYIEGNNKNVIKASM